MATVLSKKTHVRGRPVTLYSLDGVNWGSDIKNLKKTLKLQKLRCLYDMDPEKYEAMLRSVRRGNRNAARLRRWENHPWEKLWSKNFLKENK